MTYINRMNEFNSIIHENDMIYCEAAKALGLSDCTFWILYALQEEDSLTQKKLCDILYIPKQTVNSALKKMKSDGIITFLSDKNKRSKLILLTEKGVSVAARTVDNIIRCEQESFSCLTPEEQNAFLLYFRKYTDSMKTNVKNKYLPVSTKSEINTEI